MWDYFLGLATIALPQLGYRWHKFKVRRQALQGPLR